MQRELTPEEKKMFYCFLILSIIIVIISIVSNIYTNDSIAKLQKENYELSKRYILLNQGKYVNLTKRDCRNFELFVRLNETKDCLRPLNQLNDSTLDSIYNQCGQDILIKCG